MPPFVPMRPSPYHHFLIRRVAMDSPRPSSAAVPPANANDVDGEATRVDIVNEPVVNDISENGAEDVSESLTSSKISLRQV